MSYDYQSRRQHSSKENEVVVVIRATEERISVYRHKEKSGTWVNSNDCTTEYQEAELRFT